MWYSNEFYFLTPADLVRMAGIPPECGWKNLIGRDAGFFNYDPENWAYCMITVPAPWRK
jgi:hypothetical protein